LTSGTADISDIFIGCLFNGRFCAECTKSDDEKDGCEWNSASPTSRFGRNTSHLERRRKSQLDSLPQHHWKWRSGNIHVWAIASDARRVGQQNKGGINTF
jgi:hypothetical protein